MPKGLRSYKLGNTVVVRNMACGRVFTGVDRELDAQINLHKKLCDKCSLYTFADRRETIAPANVTPTQLTAQAIQRREAENTVSVQRG